MASVGNYNLVLPMIPKEQMIVHESFKRPTVWKEIKAIRNADRNCAVIPQQNRFVSYGSLSALLDELALYHSFITAHAGGPQQHEQQQNNNDNDGDQEMDQNDDQNQEQEPAERIDLPLCFQISSPVEWVTSEIISSWFGAGNDENVPHNFVNKLCAFVQEYFDGFGKNYNISLEGRAYNELVKKYVAATFDALTQDKAIWLGNQHRVMVKKSNSINNSLGTAHIIVSFDWAAYIRNDAPEDCHFRCDIVGPPAADQYKDNDDMIAEKENLEIAIGKYLCNSMDVVKGCKSTRMETIKTLMAELEQKKQEYANSNEQMIIYYEEMDKLRKERSLLLESVEINFNDNNNNDNDIPIESD